ncbi:MAG: RNA-binding protein [Candidatus Omnitrophica bacterium]|nr:RNA-binding protein [Candidatus Omnitrophota bacterium]
MNIFVGNLPHASSEEDLRKEFETFGVVSKVSILKDKFTGAPRGFGFVEMANDQEAKTAMDALNGKEFMGRPLNVNEARPKEESGPRGGGASRGGWNRDRNDRGGRRDRY